MIHVVQHAKIDKTRWSTANSLKLKVSPSPILKIPTINPSTIFIIFLHRLSTVSPFSANWTIHFHRRLFLRHLLYPFVLPSLWSSMRERRKEESEKRMLPVGSGHVKPLAPMWFDEAEKRKEKMWSSLDAFRYASMYRSKDAPYALTITCCKRKNSRPMKRIEIKRRKRGEVSGKVGVAWINSGWH